ncbi:hypothetical protein JJL45_11590 [Tamlana sp. s12]|uniref:hypothetical protein n=1 Tax=Tamlana sp. s12 TaxID=1630406 RepID=UPI000A928647|nr:hypothetical protein [Tamlana sp. s12]QQY81565.1 hypothetical protein JJL45_11590 [Tamlana sp. s12]
MRKIIIGFLLIFTTSYSYSQEWNEDFGAPVVVLVETNPWLMVIGSDVPTIAIYESGNIVYKRIEKKKMHYYSVKLDSAQTQDLIYSLGITDSLVNMKEYIEAAYSTDQPTNELILNFNEPIVKQVYGNLRDDKVVREKTPKEFLTVYDNLIIYKNKKEKEWIPDNIEIMLTDYSHSPEKPKEWPENWPNLESELTVKRSESLYSLYLPKEHFEEFKALISDLKEKQAIEINGKKFSVSYRLPFPNLR